MTETLVTGDGIIRHFADVPKRLGLKNDKGKVEETRGPENPDLVLLIVGFGGKVRRVRLQLNDHIAANPEIQQMFCEPLLEEDMHGTVGRIGLRQDIPMMAERRFISHFAQNISDFDPFTAYFGETWKTGDAVMSVLTAEQGDPIREIHELGGKALTAVDLEPFRGEFTSHSSDRYAKDLPLERTEEVLEYIEKGRIEPESFEVNDIVVAGNWPEDDSTYKYRAIAKVSLRGEPVVYYPEMSR